MKDDALPVHRHPRQIERYFAPLHCDGRHVEDDFMVFPAHVEVDRDHGLDRIGVHRIVA
ncbi:MAG TPA: hypothetical protein VNT77_09375 [Allosphingosinicella sp.]|nr:hypothetical protein [Allosphingosinicella sp.]